MSLIEAIQAENQEARVKALDVYRETLQRDADPKPGDAKRLQAAMATLGYGPDRLAGDLTVLRRAATLERDAAGDTAELAEQVATAFGVLNAHVDETARLAADREAARIVLAVAADSIANRQSQARDAGRRLGLLQQEHRALFGLPALEPVAEPDRVIPGFSILLGPPESERERAARRPIYFDTSVLPQPGRSPVPTSSQRQAAGGQGDGLE